VSAGKEFGAAQAHTSGACTYDVAYPPLVYGWWACQKAGKEWKKRRPHPYSFSACARGRWRAQPLLPFFSPKRHQQARRHRPAARRRRDSDRHAGGRHGVPCQARARACRCPSDHPTSRPGGGGLPTRGQQLCPPRRPKCGQLLDGPPQLQGAGAAGWGVPDHFRVKRGGGVCVTEETKK